MIDYKLALELKNAGFPQKNPNLDAKILEVLDGTLNNKYIKPLSEEDTMYYPTLEELIEACGDEFELLRMVYQGNDKYFIAQRHSTGEFYSGSTPKEAVSRLYLEINKK